MKRFVTVILTAAIAATMIAGCGNKLSDTDPSAPTGLTTAEPSVSEEVPTETTQYIPKSFEELYGNQLGGYLNHQYYFDGEPIPKQISNYYFIFAFSKLRNYVNMGYYPSTPLGFLDLAYEFEGDEYETYGDFFAYSVEQDLEKACILCARAKAEGLSLDDNSMKSIDYYIEQEKEFASGVGLSFEEYLLLVYGPGMDEANYRAALEMYYLVDAYTEEYCLNYNVYELTDEDYKVPYVRYALFYAPEGATQDDKDKALASANAMKDACKSLDDLKDLAETGLSERTVFEQGDYEVFKNISYKNFDKWAYSKDRKTGDIDVIYAPEAGYFVVGYLGLKETVTFPPYIRYALFSAPETADQATKEQALQQAKAMKDACKTINDLTDLAWTGINNGTVAGQDYLLVTKDLGISELEEWSNDANRKEGDIDIIYVPGYGYFVAGFLGTQKCFDDALHTVINNKLEKSVAEDIKAKKYGFHTDDPYEPAPTASAATPAPEATDIPVQSLDPNATVPSGSTETANTDMSTTDVLIIIFFTLAGIAILAIIVILINYAVKNSKKGSGVSDMSESDDELEDESEDEGEEETGEDEEDTGDEEEDESEKSEESDPDEEEKE